MSARKSTKKPKRKQATRKLGPVTVIVPDYITSSGMPYRVRTVVGLPEEAYGVEAEVGKTTWTKDEFESVREFLVCYSHLLLELARKEHAAKLEDHDELDRLAHIIAEGYEALIMGQ